MANLNSILDKLQKKRNPDNLKGMSNFGISTENALGIKIITLREIAKETGINTKLSFDLWDSGFHEARILASMIANPNEITKQIINNWVEDIYSWDLCDQCCNNLFRKTRFAIDYSFIWTKREKEFVKRAGFVLIALLSVHNKSLRNEDFQKYFPLIIKYSKDERQFVKKAVNWSLRQIGKRNFYLYSEAIETAETILQQNSKSAQWIAKDALRELTSEKVKNRILREDINKY